MEIKSTKPRRVKELTSTLAALFLGFMYGTFDARSQKSLFFSTCDGFSSCSLSPGMFNSPRFELTQICDSSIPGKKSKHILPFMVIYNKSNPAQQKSKQIQVREKVSHVENRPSRTGRIRYDFTTFRENLSCRFEGSQS